MKKSNRYLGSTFDNWLDEKGLREEVNSAAVKAVLAYQLADAMKKSGITKAAMAERMRTSRAQLDRLLDPDNAGVTIETLQRAAKAVGRELRLELI